MPTYTYHCDNCGVNFERQQHFSDPPVRRCPECNKKTLRKVFMPVNIVFKGSGFYATDHRSPSGVSRTTAAGEKESEPTTDKTKEKDVKKEPVSNPAKEKSD